MNVQEFLMGFVMAFLLITLTATAFAAGYDAGENRLLSTLRVALISPPS